MCVNKLSHISSDNGLSPGRRQAIIWTNDRKLLNLSKLRNKLQWHLKINSYHLIQENAFENVVWKMAAILSRPQYVEYLIILCCSLQCFDATPGFLYWFSLFLLNLFSQCKFCVFRLFSFFILYHCYRQHDYEQITYIYTVEFDGVMRKKSGYPSRIKILQERQKLFWSVSINIPNYHMPLNMRKGSTYTDSFF